MSKNGTEVKQEESVKEVIPDQKEQKQHEPTPNHPRFKQVYKDNKTKERVIEEKNLQIEELMMNTRRLQEKLDSFEGEYRTDKANQTLDKLRGKMRKAVELSDTESFDKLETQYRSAQGTVSSPPASPPSETEKDFDVFLQLHL